MIGIRGQKEVYRCDESPDGINLKLLSIEPSLTIDKYATIFNWGYSGNAPIQLAIAILLDATEDPVIAKEFYFEFKKDIVSKFGVFWKISKQEVLEWLNKQQSKRALSKTSWRK